MKITLLRAGGLGDVLLSLSIIQELRKCVPDVEITLFGHLDAANLLKDQGLVQRTNRQGTGGMRQYDSVIEMMGRMKQRTTPEWQERYKKALHDPDLIIMWSTDAIHASFALEDMGISQFTVDNWQPSSGMHQSEFMINTLRNAGFRSRWVYTDGIEPLHFTYEIPRGTLPSAFDKQRTVIIHPGSGGEWKRAPLSLFQQLALELDKLGYLTIIIEGPEEDGLYRSKFPSSFIIRSASLRTLASVLSLRLPYIGNDSGVSHLAGVCGAPTVAIFTATSPSQWAPNGPNIDIINKCEHETWGGVRTCFDEQCRYQVTVDDCLASLARVIEKKNTLPLVE